MTSLWVGFDAKGRALWVSWRMCLFVDRIDVRGLGGSAVKQRVYHGVGGNWW